MFLRELSKGRGTEVGREESNSDYVEKHLNFESEKKHFLTREIVKGEHNP